jgi:hypothetical protein
MKENILKFIVTIIILWVFITSFTQRFLCPSLTEFEIAFRIHKSFIFDFYYCKPR